MKTFLVPVALVAAAGCANLRQIQQVSMVQAKVIRIDTIYRQPGNLKQLTWRDNDEMQYVSYVSIYNEQYEVGSSVYIMKKR